MSTLSRYAGSFARLLRAVVLGLAGLSAGAWAEVVDCAQTANPACYFSFDLPNAAGRFHYYASRTPEMPGTVIEGERPSHALIALHGYPRDANKTFNAVLASARQAGRLGDTVLIAPLFQVATGKAQACRSPGLPAAQSGDALWRCGSWVAGERSEAQASATVRSTLTAIAALDALVAEVHQRWPTVRVITLAGFSGGAQLLQHSVGFAAQPPSGVRLRYVVVDPGVWLYFDPLRPVWWQAGAQVASEQCGLDAAGRGLSPDCQISFQRPAADECSQWNQWKYGTENLPAGLGRNVTERRVRYVAAEVHYLVAANDTGTAGSAAYGALDKSCAAQLQGRYRLQRALAYAVYAQTHLRAASAHALTVVPGCAHDVACVFPTVAAQTVLFPATGVEGKR